MADFPFIVSNGPKVPKDPALRTLIRKQAMKDVGIARKKRGRLNVRQEPVRVQEETSGSNTSIDSTAGSSSDSTPATLDACDDTVTSIDDDRTVPADDPLDEETLEWLSEQTWMMPFHGSPITGYEQLRMKYNFDIRDLSILTSFNVGKNTLMAISANPKLLETLFGSQIQSYLQYVPSRYGHKPFLTDVIDCLLAKVHSRLQPPSRSCDTIVMQKYAKALGSLQTAVAGEESSLDPDLLCAIQMLSLHEMLDPQRTAAYDHHVNGSSLIIKRRTPSRFKTDYEKLLFHSHIGPTLTRALYEQKECYLEQPEWMRLYESLIEETPYLTDRSAVVIRIRIRMLSLASMLCETTKAMDPSTYDEGLLLVLELKVREIHHGLLKALEDFKAYIFRMSMASAPESELALRREIFGTALECLCVYKRILASFCEDERLQLEKEAQQLAVAIMELQKQPAPRHSWIYSSHEKGVAASIQLTREDWERDLSDATPEEKRIAACRRWREFNSYLHGD